MVGNCILSTRLIFGNYSAVVRYCVWGFGGARLSGRVCLGYCSYLWLKPNKSISYCSYTNENESRAHGDYEHLAQFSPPSRAQPNRAHVSESYYRKQQECSTNYDYAKRNPIGDYNAKVFKPPH